MAFFSAFTERERILESFASNHPVYLAALRAFAREIALRQGSVTIDDVRDRIDAESFPMPAEVGIDSRILGTLFRSADFVAVGQRLTRRRERIARSGSGASLVCIYKLAPAKRRKKSEAA